jgi:hypothetical protein
VSVDNKGLISTEQVFDGVVIQNGVASGDKVLLQTLEGL